MECFFCFNTKGKGIVIAITLNGNHGHKLMVLKNSYLVAKVTFATSADAPPTSLLREWKGIHRMDDDLLQMFIWNDRTCRATTQFMVFCIILAKGSEVSLEWSHCWILSQEKQDSPRLFYDGEAKLAFEISGVVLTWVKRQNPRRWLHSNS